MKNFIRRAAAIAVNAALAAGMLTAAVSVNAEGAAAPVPSNAIFVNECLANSKASTQTVTVDENGATRTAAYSTENGQEPENKLDMLSLLESGSVTLYDSTDLTDKPRTDEETMEQAKNVFDGDVSTCSDFRLDGGKGSFLVIDLGRGCEISLDGAAVTARNDRYYTRIKGFKIQGANEVDDPLAHDGWTVLTSEAESAEGEQTLTVTDNGGYRYLRLYNANAWFGNIGELKLYGTYTKHEYDIAENGYIRLGRDGFTASANSSNSTDPAANAIDGDLGTNWHSSWASSSLLKFDKNGEPDGEKPPYMLTVDMGEEKLISRYIYAARTYVHGNSGSTNGVVTKFEIQVSNDAAAWETVAEGSWEYELTDGANEEQTATFDPVTARYARLIVRDGMSGNGTYYGSAAEVWLASPEDEDAKPVTEAKAALEEALETIPEDTADGVLQYIREKASEYISEEHITVEKLEKVCELLDCYNSASEWIGRGIDPWYFERLNTMLSESGLDDETITKYCDEVSAFNAKGSELDADILRDMGEEFVMSDAEKEMPLIERIADAVSRAKAQIDKYPGENYIMLKELISYVSRGDDPKYTDVRHIYGVDAATCEYIVTNINFTLKNLDGKASVESDGKYRSGTMWLDKYGSKISAGGGQVIEGNDGKYYWYGEDNKVAYALHTGVSCYSTEDFVTWTYEGLAFNAFDSETNAKFTDEFMTDPIKGTQGRIERPKVIYNAKNDTYVMWMHLEKDGVYTFSEAGVAVSDSPTGPFVWKWYGKPVYDGYTTYNSQIDQAFRDMNLFVDDDGEAYVIYSSEANRVPYIVRLNDDYTWIDTDGMNTVTEEDFKNGTAKYDENGVYTTGTLYGYSSDGTGYVNESGGAYTPTEEDLKTLTYVDTTTAGINGNIATSGKYNYYLPSFNRYQLTCGNRILIRQGTTVDRADGLEYIPLTEGEYGRWAKIGQYGSGLSNYREAPAIIKKDGVYYMIASGISGWKANTGIYLRTTDLFGEWETCTNPFVGEGQTNYGSSYSYSMGLWYTAFYPNAGKSFLSQSTCIFEYGGNYYYMGDRWKDGDYWDDGHLGVKKSTYVWLPITFTDNAGGTEDISIEWTDEFEITLPQDPEPEPEPELSVTYADGKAVYSVSIPESIRGTVYVALRDAADGTLQELRIDSLTGEFSVENVTEPELELMVWNEDQAPQCDAKRVQINK